LRFDCVDALAGSTPYVPGGIREFVGGDEKMQCYSRTYSASSFWRPLSFALAVAWSLGLLHAPVASAVEAPTLSSVATVLDPATLVVQVAGGASQSIHLTGIAPYAADDRACGAAQAVARIDQLTNDQTVSVEMLTSPETETSPPPAYVWMADGDNLAQVLVREGRVPAARDEAHPLQSAFDAAQTAAIADHVGIWAPGACRPAPDDPAAQGSVDRGGLAAYVTSSTFALQRARLAVSVLRDQSRSAPFVASTPSWQATTTTALDWLAQSVQALQAPALSGGPAGPVHTQLQQLGDDLQNQMQGFADGVRSGDVSQMHTAAAQLNQTADAFSPTLAELNALVSSYGLGD
jgi:endonuclease YncB( thermonuclease family)